MAHTAEPDIAKGNKPEEAFQEAVEAEIKKILDKKRSEAILNGISIEYSILDGFGLDIAIIMKFGDSLLIRLLELKAFVGSRMGGVGFGDKHGKGSQVDLLLLNEQGLSLVDQFIRWILADGTKAKGADRFAIFDNRQAKNAAMGGVERGKQNNLNINKLTSNAITWDQLSEELEIFLGF